MTDLQRSNLPAIISDRSEIVPATEGDAAAGRPALRIHPRNPRRGDIAAIAESITDHGFYTVLLAQASTGYVIAGNHRLQAARLLGMPELPVIFMDVDDDAALRLVLRDNRSTDLAEYDETLLTEILSEFGDSPKQWTGTGYGTDDIADLLGVAPAVSIDPGRTRRDSVTLDEPYATLPYYGGKSGYRSTCKFILGLLPYATPDDRWIEPCGGFYGVGINRPEPRGRELLNDSNGRVVNWWQVVRTRTDEITHHIAHTPSARLEFDEAVAWLLEHHPHDRDLDTLDADERLRSATATTIVIFDSIRHHDGEQVSWSASVDSRPLPVVASRFARLAERMADVRLEHGDAAGILDRWHSEPAAITYFDPPYPQRGDRYSTGPLANRDGYAELLLAQTGRVLVSGYTGDWPALDDAGWHRHEHTTYSALGAAFSADAVRTECVWTNYDPPEPDPDGDNAP